MSEDWKIKKDYVYFLEKEIGKIDFNKTVKENGIIGGKYSIYAKHKDFLENEEIENFKDNNSFFNQEIYSNNSDKINLKLTSTSGKKFVIIMGKNNLLIDVIKKLSPKVRVQVSTLKKECVFLFNAEKLNLDDTRPLGTLFKHNEPEITVLVQNNIIGP